jgi:hypothetical protein
MGSLYILLQGKQRGSLLFCNHICFIAIAIVPILKMTSYLNTYCNFINISMKDGQMLLSNATNKFKSPLDSNNKISLRPGGKDYQKLKDNLTRILQQFGYQHLLQSIPTVHTLTPAILPFISNAAAGIIAAPRIPILITYTNGINIMEVYSDKLLKISQKDSSLTWGFGLFTNQTPQVIHELTQADGDYCYWLTLYCQKGSDSKETSFQDLSFSNLCNAL